MSCLQLINLHKCMWLAVTQDLLQKGSGLEKWLSEWWPFFTRWSIVDFFSRVLGSMSWNTLPSLHPSLLEYEMDQVIPEHFPSHTALRLKHICCEKQREAIGVACVEWGQKEKAQSFKEKKCIDRCSTFHSLHFCSAHIFCPEVRLQNKAFSVSGSR